MSTLDPPSDDRAPRAWTAGVFRLGHEPREGPDETTTAEQRLAMVWDLTRRMWALTGKPLPTYSRADTPVLVIRR